MDGRDQETQAETRSEEREIANMDAYDYLTMLMESRIIQYA